MREKLFMPMKLQYFASDSGSDGGASDTGADARTGAGEEESKNEGDKAIGQNNDSKDNNKPLTTEAIEKIIQSRVDKSTADLGKTIAQLKKENEQLKKDSLSADELKKFEISEKEKELAEREKTLLDRENRLFAIKAIKEIGLDDGSQNSLKLVDFVIGGDEKEITEKVKAFNELVQGFVSARVESKFKDLGRTPNGAKPTGTDNKQTSVAEQLGKQRAEQEKRSNDILNMYLGGKK